MALLYYLNADLPLELGSVQNALIGDNTVIVIIMIVKVIPIFFGIIVLAVFIFAFGRMRLHHVRAQRRKHFLQQFLNRPRAMLWDGLYDF